MNQISLNKILLHPHAVLATLIPTLDIYSKITTIYQVPSKYQELN